MCRIGRTYAGERRRLAPFPSGVFVRSAVSAAFQVFRKRAHEREFDSAAQSYCGVRPERLSVSTNGSFSIAPVSPSRVTYGSSKVKGT